MMMPAMRALISNNPITRHSPSGLPFDGKIACFFPLIKCFGPRARLEEPGNYFRDIQPDETS